MGPPPGDPANAGPDNDTALLQSVLTFYERFAHRNEANPRLQGEAAWAYFKVGRLCEKLGRLDEAKQSISHATEMLEILATQFPAVLEYRSKLVQIAIMTDPWSVDLSTLEPVAARLSRARELIDQLAQLKPQNLDYIQAQVHVYAKLGTVFERRQQLADAEACYRRAIDLAGTLIERLPESLRPRIDRADVREALAYLKEQQGLTDEARALLEAAVSDLRSLWVPGSAPPIAQRFESLAKAVRSLGDARRADEIARLATGAGRRPPRKRPGGPPGEDF